MVLLLDFLTGSSGSEVGKDLGELLDDHIVAGKRGLHILQKRTNITFNNIITFIIKIKREEMLPYQLVKVLLKRKGRLSIIVILIINRPR